MSLTHTITRTYRSSGDSLNSTLTLSGDGEEARSLVFAVSATDTEVNLGIRYAGLKGLYISSDRALTVETNSSSAPNDTISVAANVAYLWTHQDGTANPLSADVTKVFLTATGSGNATVEIRVLQDATP